MTSRADTERTVAIMKTDERSLPSPKDGGSQREAGGPYHNATRICKLPLVGTCYLGMEQGICDSGEIVLMGRFNFTWLYQRWTIRDCFKLEESESF